MISVKMFSVMVPCGWWCDLGIFPSLVAWQVEGAAELFEQLLVQHGLMPPAMMFGRLGVN